MHFDKDIVDFTTDEVITTPTGTFTNLFTNYLECNERKMLLHFNTIIHSHIFVMRFINLYRLSAAIWL
jgi:hypothetical protein